MRSTLLACLLAVSSGCGIYVEVVPEHPFYQPGECVWLEVRNTGVLNVELQDTCNPVLEQQVNGAFVAVPYVGHEFCLLMGQGVGALKETRLAFPLESDRAPGTYRLVLGGRANGAHEELVSEPFEVLDTEPVEGQLCALNPERR